MRDFPTLDAAPCLEPVVECEPVVEPEIEPAPHVAVDRADEDRARLEEILDTLLGMKERLQAARA